MYEIKNKFWRQDVLEIASCEKKVTTTKIFIS